MTAFIESFATPKLLPPWEAERVQTWLFGFPLAKQVVTKYVDKFFNLGAPDEARYCFEAQAGDQTLGTLLVSRYPKIVSDNPSKGSGQGADLTPSLCVSQTQVSVVVPVNRLLVTAGPCEQKLDPQFYYFQPFTISDNSYMVFANREIIGTDMMLGQITLRDDKHGMRVETKIPAIEKFSPRSKEEELPFLRIVTGFPQRLSAQPPPAPSKAPMVFQTVGLKQFRDTADLRAATYQAIVTSTVTYRNPHDFHFFDPASVSLQFTLSDTVKEILESFLDLQDLPAHPLKFAFGFTSDVRLDQVATLHSFESRETRSEKPKQ
jgi:hypothetical protein